MQENKLSLAQINGRLSQLRDKRDELEEEKRALLNQTQASDDSVATALVVPKTEPFCKPINNKLVITNNINNVVTNHRPPTLHQQQQHIFKQHQNSINAQSSTGSPAAGSGLSPLAQHSLMMHNSSTGNTGGSNQTLLVCSPAAVDALAANNQNNNGTRSTMSLPASLSSPMTYTKMSSLYSNSTHLLAPNIGTSNKTGRTPSPQPQSIQQQNYQQQIVVPFSPYKSMNSGGSNSENLNSGASAPIVNNINQPLATATNSNYPVDNSNKRGIRDDNAQSFNRNVWINNMNNTNKNSMQNILATHGFIPSTEGSYAPSAASFKMLDDYKKSLMKPESSSPSSVNTVYSYTGPPPPLTRTESSSSGSLMVSAAGKHGAQQMPKPITSHQHHPYHHNTHSHPPMYMSPGIQNQTSNHTYHSNPPHSVYPDVKFEPAISNFYQQQSNRNVHTSNTTTAPMQPHQMSKKSHNIGYPMQHSTAVSQISQLPPPIIQSSQHATYNASTCSVTGYSNKSPATVVSSADIPRYQQPPPIPMSRHE